MRRAATHARMHWMQTPVRKHARTDARQRAHTRTPCAAFRCSPPPPIHPPTSRPPIHPPTPRRPIPPHPRIPPEPPPRGRALQYLPAAAAPLSLSPASSPPPPPRPQQQRVLAATPSLLLLLLFLSFFVVRPLPLKLTIMPMPALMPRLLLLPPRQHCDEPAPGQPIE